VSLESRTRPLTEPERRLVRTRLAQYGRREAGVGRATTGAAILVIGALWLVTLAVADAPWSAVTAFWLVVGGGIYLWVRRDLRRESAHIPALRAALAGALERDEASVLDVRATAYAELEEAEDEGACFAFQVDDDRLLFLHGQEFYPSAGFPSHDFSLVSPLDPHGGEADRWIEKRGEAVPPARVIPAAAKWELADGIPASGTVIPGTLDRLEAILRERAG
jgi:hypothetical protein